MVCPEDETRLVGEPVILAGRYRLLDPIGRGGMATVYRAEQLNVERPVAIKMLRAEVTGEAGFVDNEEVKVGGQEVDEGQCEDRFEGSTEEGISEAVEYEAFKVKASGSTSPGTFRPHPP